MRRWRLTVAVFAGTWGVARLNIGNCQLPFANLPYAILPFIGLPASALQRDRFSGKAELAIAISPLPVDSRQGAHNVCQPSELRRYGGAPLSSPSPSHSTPRLCLPISPQHQKVKGSKRLGFDNAYGRVFGPSIRLHLPHSTTRPRDHTDTRHSRAHIHTHTPSYTHSHTTATLCQAGTTRGPWGRVPCAVCRVAVQFFIRFPSNAWVQCSGATTSAPSRAKLNIDRRPQSTIRPFNICSSRCPLVFPCPPIPPPLRASLQAGTSVFRASPRLGFEACLRSPTHTYTHTRKLSLPHTHISMTQLALATDRHSAASRRTAIITARLPLFPVDSVAKMNPSPINLSDCSRLPLVC
jgi:hypothetical protein